MKTRTTAAEFSHTGAWHRNVTEPTTLLLLAPALKTNADELARKLRDAKMHWKFRSPTPCEIQLSGDPNNLGYTPLETDTEMVVPPLAEMEVPEETLTDAQDERP